MERWMMIAALSVLATTSVVSAAPRPKRVQVTNFPATLNVSVQNPPEPPLAPTRPSQLVTNYQDTGPACPGGGFSGARLIESQLGADGSTTAFTIPPGQVFVITSVEVSVLTTASISDEVRVGIPCGPGCMKPVFDLQVTTDGFGQGGTTLELTNGVAIKPGVTLCSADVNHSSPNAFATLRGYFTDDR